MKKTALLLTLLLSGGISAVFFVPFVSASFAPIPADNFNNFNRAGWTVDGVSPPLRFGVASSSLECYVGDCVQGAIGATGASKMMLPGPLPYDTAFRFYLKIYSGTINTANWHVGAKTCATGACSAIGSWAPVNAYGVTHAYTFAYHVLSNGNIGMCTLTDATDISTCSYSDTSVVASSSPLVAWEFFAGNSDYVLDEFNSIGNPLSPDYYNSLGVATSTVGGVPGTQEFCAGTFDPSSFLNIGYGLCTSFAFLFVPSQTAVSGFQGTMSSASDKIPFSYFFDVKGTFEGLSASTTQNFQSYGLNLAILDSSSSTAMGPILPTGNFSFFSTTTINRFLPAGLHDILYFLMQAVIWVGLAFMLYRRIVPTKAELNV